MIAAIYARKSTKQTGPIVALQLGRWAGRSVASGEQELTAAQEEE